MKKLFLIVISVSSFQAFSACNTALDIKLFNNPFANAKSAVKYNRVVKVFKTLGFEVKEIAHNPKYRTQIELGVETAQDKNVLLSYVQVANRDGKVVFENYRSRKVQADDLISTEQMLEFTARHLSRTFPLCD
jgi:hypothetical protein